MWDLRKEIDKMISKELTEEEQKTLSVPQLGFLATNKLILTKEYIHDDTNSDQ